MHRKAERLESGLLEAFALRWVGMDRPCYVFQASAHLDRETAKWGPIVKEANITLQ